MKFKNVWIALCSVIAMLVVAGGVAQAQGPMRTSEGKINKMKQELNLTDEQVKQITPIIQSEMQKRKELMDQMRNLHQDTETKIGQFLTPEQMTQWKNLQEQRKKNKPFRHGG
ncbi:MAG TPA: Spy/CpxP family protein refolding chaperone [Thermodesulfobacteriota bacterium]|nr:Spy/CpxP family protein refolding chaperone [Thermodesulfobacteriota bacterium]